MSRAQLAAIRLLCRNYRSRVDQGIRDRSRFWVPLIADVVVVDAVVVVVGAWLML